MSEHNVFSHRITHVTTWQLNLADLDHPYHTDFAFTYMSLPGGPKSDTGTGEPIPNRLSVDIKRIQKLCYYAM